MAQAQQIICLSAIKMPSDFSPEAIAFSDLSCRHERSAPLNFGEDMLANGLPQNYQSSRSCQRPQKPDTADLPHRFLLGVRHAGHYPRHDPHPEEPRCQGKVVSQHFR